MKKILTALLLLFLVTFAPPIPTQAANQNGKIIERLSNGDYIVKEHLNINALLNTEKTGSCKVSYYTANDVLVFSLVLNASFEYTYGVQSKATSAEASVTVYLDNASFQEKDAYTSANTAYATGVVRYLGRDIRLNADLSCDIYGKLS